MMSYNPNIIFDEQAGIRVEAMVTLPLCGPAKPSHMRRIPRERRPFQ